MNRTVVKSLRLRFLKIPSSVVNQCGFSILEVLFSIGLFSIVASGMTASFVGLQRRNYENEVRTAAIGAAQKVLDEARVLDPATLPTSGSASTTVTYGSKSFDVTTTYCAIPAECSSANVRQLRVAVSYRGTQRYKVDTIFCQLR